MKKEINREDIHHKLKVALVVPNFLWCDWDLSSKWHFIPYNLCLIAAVSRNIADITIIDANLKDMNDEAFVSELKKSGPDVIGITVLMDQYGPAGHYAAKLSKIACPDSKVVVGGVYATMNPEKVILDTNVDYVIVGEGEYVFKELLQHFTAKYPFPSKGICYKTESKIINLGCSDRINDLDSLPLPAYDLIDYLEYVSELPSRRSVDMPPELPYARILTSRGCPVGCVFCQVESISGKKFRPRSASSVLDEIEWMKARYGIKSLIFDDDNLFLNKKRAMEIFGGMIKRELVMPWVSIATAAFCLDEELLDIMKKSGCEYIDIAIESGSQRVLKEIIGKPIDLKQVSDIAGKARKMGIYVAANFVIGFPTETWNEIRKSIKFAEDIDVDYVKLFVAIPLPHTKLWQLCTDTEAFKKSFQAGEVRWNYGQIETDQFSANDLTILRAYEWDRINFTDSNKAAQTAKRMKITLEELWKIRRGSLDSVIGHINANNGQQE
ncbi:MAG: radical SAM protein [Lentisphaerota bacterium]